MYRVSTKWAIWYQYDVILTSTSISKWRYQYDVILTSTSISKWRWKHNQIWAIFGLYTSIFELNMTLFKTLIWHHIDVKFTLKWFGKFNFKHGWWDPSPKYYFIISIIHPHTQVIFITTHWRIHDQHETSTYLLLPVVDNIRF